MFRIFTLQSSATRHPHFTKCISRRLKSAFQLSTLVLLMYSPLSSAVDLLGVYSGALATDAGLQVARHNYLSEAQSERIGRALLLPSVTARLRYGSTKYRSDSPDFSGALDSLPSSTNCLSNIIGCANQIGESFERFSSSGTDSNYDVTEYSVSLLQPLYDKERWHQYKKSKLLNTRGAILYRQAELELVYRSAERYLQVLQAISSLRQAETEHKAMQRQLRFAQSQLKNGLGRASNLYELQSAVKLKNTQIQSYKSGLHLALAELSSLAGRSITRDSLQTFATAIPVRPLRPKVKEAWLNLAQQYNLQLLNSSLEIRLAEEEYNERRGARMPKVNFVAAYNKTDTSGGQGFIPGAEVSSYGVDLSAPLFQGGGLSAAQKKAMHQYRATQQKMRQDFNRLKLSVDALVSQIAGNVEAYRVLQEALLGALRAQKNLDSGASKGIVSVPEVLQSRQNVSQIKAQVEALRYEYLLNKLKLRQLVGILDESDLIAINGLTQAVTANTSSH